MVALTPCNLCESPFLLRAGGADRSQRARGSGLSCGQVHPSLLGRGCRPPAGTDTSRGLAHAPPRAAACLLSAPAWDGTWGWVVGACCWGCLGCLWPWNVGVPAAGATWGACAGECWGASCWGFWGCLWPGNVGVCWPLPAWRWAPGHSLGPCFSVSDSAPLGHRGGGCLVGAPQSL